jgi:hypothetical protein
LAIGLLLESFSVKVKVLEGGFSLWLGDNISILSMVKRAHPLFLTLRRCTLCRSKMEIIDHFMVHCAFSKEVWKTILPSTGGHSTWYGASLLDCMKIWFEDNSKST